MPALLDLADELQARFTFFVNAGRAVSLKTLFGRKPSCESAPKLSSLRKQSWKNYLYTATWNPPLFRIDGKGYIARAVAEGHDVGLHGGRNHACWQHDAHAWDESAIRQEIEWGIRALRYMGVSNVTSFASPGWNTPTGLETVLPEYGIAILADQHGPEYDAAAQAADGEVVRVPTNMLGEPGGVGYLEWRTAQRQSHEEAMTLFTEELQIGDKACYVIYDHPCFAGVEGLPLLRAMVQFCQQTGIRIATVSELARTLTSTLSSRSPTHD